MRSVCVIRICILRNIDIGSNKGYVAQTFVVLDFRRTGFLRHFLL